MRFRCHLDRNVFEFVLKYYPKTTTTIKKEVNAKYKTHWETCPSPIQFNYTKKEEEKLVLFCKIYDVRVHCPFKWCWYIKLYQVHAHTHTHTYVNIIHYLMELYNIEYVQR